MEEFFHSTTAVRILFVLGIVNMVLGIMLFLSCRCIPMSAFAGKRLMKYPLYQHFYKLHCYIWPILIVSIITHTVFGIKFLGNPF